MRDYDLIVLGTGTAGGRVARRCRREGWSVANIDCRPPGGTCANRGCDAKKPLVNSAYAVELFDRLRGRGVDGQVTLNWRDTIHFKRTFTDPIPEKERHELAELGMDLFEGRPRFVGPTELEVDGERLRGRRIVIATGRRPRPLDMPGEERVTTSDEFLDMEELPRRLIFIGGGYVSFEFAHAAARAGHEIVILEMLDRVLGGFEADIVDVLVDQTRQVGMEVLTGSCAECVEPRDGRLAVGCNSHREWHMGDLVVHGAGRTPSLDGLDLQAAGIEADAARGVQVNEYLQSVSNPAVYAAGDVADTPGAPLSPVSNLEGGVAAHNLLHGNSRTCDYRGIPSAVFTVPPMASVGMTQQQAHREGLDVEVRFDALEGYKHLRQLGARRAAYKVLVDRTTDRIVGAHLLAPGAEETINLFALAIRHDVTATQLRRTIFAFPSHSSLVRYML